MNRIRSETSGEGNAEIVIVIAWPVPVGVHAVSIEIANIDEVAVRSTAVLLRFSIQGSSNMRAMIRTLLV